MTETAADHPVLLCYDGSDDAATAIATAGRLLGPGPATVLTVREPVELWDPWDPASILDAGLARLTPAARELDELATSLAADQLQAGVRLAQEAGFDVHGRLERGKPWRTICTVAAELDARAIVMGARGRSPVRSALLGGVSLAVSTHAGRPVVIVPHAPDHEADPAG